MESNGREGVFGIIVALACALFFLPVAIRGHGSGRSRPARQTGTQSGPVERGRTEAALPPATNGTVDTRQPQGGWSVCGHCSGTGYSGGVVRPCIVADNPGLIHNLAAASGHVDRPICTLCDGRYWNYCPGCGGRGYIRTAIQSVSPVPRMDLQPTCSRCLGTGELDCTYCGGSGYDRSPIGYRDESRAGGYLEWLCGNCAGRGKVSCYSCR